MDDFTIKIVATCFLLVSFAHLSCQRPAKTSRETSAKSEQPNILFILLDDVGWNDVSYHGSEIRFVLVNAHSHCAFFFSDCDCDSSFRNKWVVQDSVEVFTLCDCDNITNSYVAHFK